MPSPVPRRSFLPRMRPATALLVGLLALAAVWGAVRSATGSNDFDGFHRAAAHLWTHGEISTAKDVRRYLPTFSLLLLPLGALPLVPAAILWTLLNAAAMAALPRAFERLASVPRARQLGAFWVCAPLLANNLTLGQSGPVLLWLAVTALARVRAGRAAAGGALLGLATLLKIVPLALAAVPVLAGRRARPGRFVLGVLGVLWVGALATVLAVGPARAWSEARRWVDEAGGGQTPWALVQTGRSLRFNNQGAAVTLARTFGDLSPEQVDAARGAVRIASIPLASLWTMWALLALAATALLCVVARRARGDMAADAGALRPADDDAPGAAAAEGRAWLACLAAGAAWMLVLCPLVWTHYFVWQLPALVLLVHRPRVLWTAGIVLALALASPELRALGIHMAGTLVLTVLAVRAAPGETSRALVRAESKDGSPAG